MSVSIRNVVKAFASPGGSSVRAVDGVSLEVQEGELVTLLGASGCGKTTTLRMVAGFEEPSSGEIWLSGKNVTHLPPHRRDAPMVFQSYALFPHMKVRTNAEFGLNQRGIKGPEATRRVEALAEALGLSALLERSPHELSGGQQQRVALLRALVTEPKLLLFDEPLSNLDARLRGEIRTEIRRLQRKVGFTALYVTHDQEEAMALSDRVVVMNAGKIIQVGSPHALYQTPVNRFVARFLGEANFLEGRVVGWEEGVARVDTALGPLQAKAAQRAERGTPMTLVARPDVLSITPAESGQFVVKSTAYLGAFVAYDVEGAQQTLFVRSKVSGQPLLDEGTRVSLKVESSVLHPVENSAT